MVNKLIQGTTNIYGVIGNPISHTFSPFIHNTIAAENSDNIVYVPFHVENDNVENAINGAYALGIKGLNVTVPHKKAVMPYLYEIDKMAKIIGAVNTLKYTDNGYVGFNTDIIGVMNTFKYNDFDPKNKTAVILGAGGSAPAAVAALCEMEAKKIVIVNRSIENAKNLAKTMSLHYNIDIEVFTYDMLSNVKNIDIIIQTTSVGLGETKGLSPINDFSIFNGVSFVFDFIYNPQETVFLHEAKKHGCFSCNGFEMLVYQGVASYEIWLDKKFSQQYVSDLIKKLSSILEK